MIRAICCFTEILAGLPTDDSFSGSYGSFPKKEYYNPYIGTPKRVPLILGDPISRFGLQEPKEKGTVLRVKVVVIVRVKKVRVIAILAVIVIAITVVTVTVTVIERVRVSVRVRNSTTSLPVSKFPARG